MTPDFFPVQVQAKCIHAPRPRVIRLRPPPIDTGSSIASSGNRGGTEGTDFPLFRKFGRLIRDLFAFF